MNPRFQAERSYARIQELVDAGETDQATVLITSLEDSAEQVALLVSLAQGVAHAPALDPAWAHGLAQDLALARARARDRAGVRAGVRALARALARERPLPHDKALTLARDLVRTLVQTHARARDLAHGLSQAQDLDYVLIRARALAADLAQDLLLVRVRARDLVNILAGVADLAPTHDRVLHHAVALERAHALVQVVLSVLSALPITSASLLGLDALTPTRLAIDVSPYLQALCDLQQIIAQLKRDAFTPPTLNWIAQTSSIDFHMDDIDDAVSVVRSLIVPWRREHAGMLARSTIAQHKRDIMRTEAEIRALQAQSAQAQVTIDLGPIELERIRGAIQRMGLDVAEKQRELQSQRLVIHQNKVALAAAIIERYDVQLDTEEHSAYVKRLLQPITVLTESLLEID